ncbi:MAG: caspase family protein [Candidatus Electrothrix aestuarii]|uniref:Caspase family protein n=1 Tax=Candidatus Electrothrix aestuarii TaxID=3062594 RepID=A0AAU8LZE1_9BACT|nr:caspase family protein [Candidatus Electrothrix aestuarii]
MKRVLLLIALTVLPAAAQAQESFGRFHALVIGNQNYRYLTKLKTPKADAEAVAKVLQDQYGFTVDLLLDKSRAEILLALARLRKTMTSEEDNLLIYYAGHGYLDVPTGTGYWQPVDAQTDNTVYWIPTDEITRLLRAIRARHVLVVADSCYSGSLLMRDSGARLPTGVERDEWLHRMQKRRSRTALTSGGEEPVADGGGSGHSVFAKVFLEVLLENKGILDGDRLFDRIKTPVAANAEQTPFYGIIRMTNHDMGDFLLVPKELQEVVLQQQTGKVDLSWLRRGGQEGRRIGKYINHGDGTITDTKSGLMWKRCLEGLSGVKCEEGKVKKYEYDEAVQRFKGVEYAGYTDWRLPTFDELKNLVHCTHHSLISKRSSENFTKPD